MLFTAPFLIDLLRTILIMSISGSLIVLLLLLVKPIVRHRLPKRTQYYMWLIALATLLIPLSKIIVLPDTNTGIPITPIYHAVENIVLPNENEQDSVSIVFDPDRNQYVPSPESEVTSSENQPSLWVKVGTIFLYVYPLVAVFIILYGAISYLHFIRKIRRCPKIALPTELYTLEELKGRQHPRIYRSAFAEVPMLTGLFKPSIVLPDREYTNEHLRAILLHELTHLRQYDVVFKWLSLIACAVHWFNPVAWLMRREIDRIAELSCDEKVIRNMDNDEKQSYGDMLIMIAAHNTSRPSAVLSTTLCEDKIVLKERLAAIMQSKKSTKAGVAVSTAVVFAMAGAACVLGAAHELPNPQQPDTGQEHRALRDSDYYFVAIDQFAYQIQADGDENFIPPARAVFSFVGSLDAIRDWESSVGREGFAQLENPSTYTNYTNAGWEKYIVIDFYDEDGKPAESCLKPAPINLDVPFREFNPKIHESHSRIDPNIHKVWFWGTLGELWKTGFRNTSPPRDLYPAIFLSDGDGFLDGYTAVTYPDDWINADTIVSAEIGVTGSLDELMELWRYTEAEVIDELNRAAPSSNMYYDIWERESFDEVYFFVIDFFDATHNLVGRYIFECQGERARMPTYVRFFKTYDEYEAWLNQN